MERSGDAATTNVPAVLALFSGVGSGVGDEIVAVLSMDVPAGVPAVTLTVRVNVPEAPPARFAIEQFTVPPEPTPGVVHIQPAGDERLTNVVLAGRGSD